MIRWKFQIDDLGDDILEEDKGVIKICDLCEFGEKEKGKY